MNMSHTLRRSIKIMVETRTKELAYTLCRKYLGGEWAMVSFSNFEIERIDGGLTNHLFLCSLPNEVKTHTIYGNKVLLRIYGQTYNEMSENKFRMMEECLVYGILAERKMGPKVYGVFPEGRLEQFIPDVRSLTNIEIRVPQISKQIAEHVAGFHKLTLPLPKEATWHWSIMQKFIDEVKVMTFSDPVKAAKLEQILSTYDLEAELKFLRALIEDTNSPLVFCHNDVQPGNLLVEKSSTLSNADVKLIDFEYSCYNYRGFDIGNHFQEWMHNYNYPHYPYFDGNVDDYPTHTQKAHFVRSYLEALNGNDVSEEEVDKVIVEADRLSLLSHFYWAYWSIIQESKSTINFGYLDYAVWRLKCYEHFKFFARGQDCRDVGTRNRIIGLYH